MGLWEPEMHQMCQVLRASTKASAHALKSSPIEEEVGLPFQDRMFAVTLMIGSRSTHLISESI